MSTDYDLKCRTCNTQVELLASASAFYGQKLWQDADKLKELGEFLFAHAGHELIFIDEHHPEHRHNRPDDDESDSAHTSHAKT